MGIEEHLSQAVLGTATSLERSYAPSPTPIAVNTLPHLILTTTLLVLSGKSKI